MNPEDPSSGFRHGRVLMYINQQMSKHIKGPQFYIENLALSWEEVEEKLRILLEDSQMPSQAQEACAWSSLALGVRFAWRQGHLQGRRVQWLHDFACLHKSAAHALASDLKKFTDQQEVERKEAALQLQLAHTKLAEVQRERDLMRLKLLHAELRAFPPAEMPVVTRAPAAAAGGEKTETQNAGEKEVTTSDGAACTVEKEIDGATATAAPGEEAGTEKQKGSGQAVEWKKPSGLEGEDGKEEGEDKSMKISTGSDSEPLDLKSTTSTQPITVQLPDSFTYSYESPFPVTPTPSPPPSIITEPQMPPYFMATDMNMSETEGPTIYLQEPSKESRDIGFRLQRNIVLRRPGDWDCIWCKTVNFARRENCFRCGRRMWLQSPQ